MQEFIDPSLNIAHFAFDDVGSTNDEAFRLGQERGLNRLFVTGKRQLAGRGRRGRQWVSEEGNLYASLFLRAPANPEKCAQLSFVSSVSLHEAVSELTPDKTSCCALKWPNDILWNGAKVAGLLLEARNQNSDMNIVVGMGVNCTHHPEDTPYPATNFNAEGLAISPPALFDILKKRMLKNLEIWNRGNDFTAIRKKWLHHACGLGDKIIVRLDNEEITGLFRDINEDGHLILGQPNREDRTIAAGDVFFPSFTR